MFQCHADVCFRHLKIIPPLISRLCTLIFKNKKCVISTYKFFKKLPFKQYHNLYLPQHLIKVYCPPVGKAHPLKENENPFGNAGIKVYLVTFLINDNRGAVLRY